MITVSLESETSQYGGFSVIRLISPYVNRTHIVKLHPHEGCPNGGQKFMIQEAWSNDYYCLGCDYEATYSIGD